MNWQEELKRVQPHMELIYASSGWEFSVEGEILEVPTTTPPWKEYKGSDRFRVVATRKATATNETKLGEWRFKGDLVLEYEMRKMFAEVDDSYAEDFDRFMRDASPEIYFEGMRKLALENEYDRLAAEGTIKPPDEDKWLTRKLLKQLRIAGLDSGSPGAQSWLLLVWQIEAMISKLIAGNKKGKARCSELGDKLKVANQRINGLEAELKKLKNDHRSLVFQRRKETETSAITGGDFSRKIHSCGYCIEQEIIPVARYQHHCHYCGNHLGGVTVCAVCAPNPEGSTDG